MIKSRTILIMENRKNKIEFSVNPKELSIDDSVSNVHENIDSIGEIVLPGKRGLKTVSLSTFIPGRNSSFRKTKTPKEVKKIVERWLNRETKLRVVISNPNINFKVLLDSASFVLIEGTEDLHLNLSFTEYKDILIPDVSTIKGIINVGGKENYKNNEIIPLKDRIDDRESGVEVANSKTTLWSLAVKYYGNGNEWKKILAANPGVNVKKIKEGMVIKIP